MEENKPNLHELYVYCEWKPEPEYVQKPDGVQESLVEFWRKLRYFGAKKSLIDTISAFKEHHLKWHIALGEQGKVIAVLTDNILEIRTKRSDFSTVSARTTVPRDGYSQCRKLVWSPDCAFLVIAHGNGVVSFYDLAGTNLYNIPMNCAKPGGLECTDNTHSLAEVIFMPLRVKNVKWCWEVLLLTHDGRVRTYLVSKTEGSELHHTFSFPGAVSAATYDHTHQQLYIAGVPGSGYEDPSSPLSVGITAWRILNEEPFYKLSVVSDLYETKLVKKQFQLKIPFVSSKNLEFVVSMSLSSEGTKLVCVHSSGAISAWGVPTLRRLSYWDLVSQPHCTPNTNSTSMYFAKPAHVAWWGEHEIIISRFSGSVTICHIERMVNILGKKPEFLHGTPRITRRVDGTFIALECETTVLPAKRHHEDDTTEVLKDDESEKGSILSFTKELGKALLYAVTDLETFQPKPKKITVVSKIYRLLGFKSTTPLELVHRKIAIGQYSEALSVADEYGLDKDIVYQEQWRKANVTTDTIHNYLAKISKKIWVVHQCMDRIPETLAAAEELLHFGLELTNKEILDEVNQRRSPSCHAVDPLDIDPEELAGTSADLLRCRHTMLLYSHRLGLYREILRTEKSNYVKEEYQCLRSTSPIKSAISLAKEGRVSALTCIWSLVETYRIRLIILATLPETISPILYKHLLPKPVEDWSQDTIDNTIDQDWCYKDGFRILISPDGPETEEEEADVTNADIKTWYEKRARDMEMLSGQVSNAVCLLSLALQLGVDVKLMHFHMETLDTLVYEVDREDVTLDNVETMTCMEIAMALMEKSIKHGIVNNVMTLLIPYLKDYDRIVQNNTGYIPLLQDFLEMISVNDLKFVIAVLTKLPLTLTTMERASIIKRCIFAFQTTEEIYQVRKLRECFPKNTDKVTESSISPEELKKLSEELDIVIESSEILHRLHSPTSTCEVAEIRTRNDPQRVRLLYTRIATLFVSRPLDCSEVQLIMETTFPTMLADMIALGKRAFPDLITPETIYVIVAQAILSSENPAMFKLSSKVMVTSPEPDVTPAPGPAVRLSHTKACSLVLFAAREYYNSAGGTANDNNILLARKCLQIIQPPSEDITKELDLIAALPIIYSFGVQILPVQVRVCTNRMSIIEMCLEADPNAFNSTAKLIHLATLLHVFENDERQREAEVLMSVCGRALCAGAGGGAALSHCAARLVALRHAPAATTLRDAALATAAPLPAHARRELLAAALATTTRATDLHTLLADRIYIENEALRKDLFQKFTLCNPDEIRSDTFSTPEENSEQDSDICVEPILTMLKYWNDIFDEAIVPSPTVERRVHVQEFYRDLYGGPVGVASPFVVLPPSVPAQPASALLHHYYMMLPADKDLQSAVLLKAFEELVYSDTPLAVACALGALGDVDKYKEAIYSQESVPAVCALLYAVVTKCCQPELHEDAYRASPAQMVSKALKLEETSDQLQSLIKLCLYQIGNIIECDKFQALGFFVDRYQYCTDIDYAKDVFIQMVNVGSAEQSELASAAAARRGVDPFAIWVARAAAGVLGDAPPAPPPPAIPAARREEACTMLKSIWQYIPGQDHNKLVRYYTLVSQVDPHSELHRLTPAQHIKLLKKVKSAAPGLDYKLLVSGPPPEELTQHVASVMSSDRIGMVLKLLRGLPGAVSVTVDTDVLLAKYIVWNFFNKKCDSDEIRWIDRFEEARVNFYRLKPQQILDVIIELCFSDLAIARIISVTRHLMVMKARTYCEQKRDEADGDTTDWEMAANRLDRWTWFLRGLQLPRVISLMNTHAPLLLGNLEQSRGDTELVLPILTYLIMKTNLQPPNLQQLVTDLRLELSVTDIFSHALDQYVDGPVSMERLVWLMLAHKLGGPPLAERALAAAAHHQLPPHRLSALLALTMREQLEKTEEGVEPELDLVMEYSIQLFRAEWPSLQLVHDLTVEHLRSPSGRRHTLGILLEEARGWAARHTLAAALRYWPPRDRTESEWRSVHALLVAHALAHCDDEDAATRLVRELFATRPALSDAEILELEQMVSEAGGSVTFLWVMLLSDSETIYQHIPLYLQKHKIDSLSITNELIEEILERSLLVPVVGTSLYPSVVRYVLEQDEEEEFGAAWATSVLQHAGLHAEAANLHMMAVRIPNSLRTFTQALLYLRRSPD